MKTSEILCAKMNLAECLENFIEETKLSIEYLTMCLEDENREHDPEVDDSAKESIRIDKKSIELAMDFLGQLEC